MDSLTHGLLASYLLFSVGLPLSFLLPVIVGATFPDIDVLFRPLSDKYPRFFIFTHGGFTHSFAGTLITALSLTTITALLLLTGLPVPPIGLFLFLAFFSGSLVHVVLDLLAFPGIPILYPFSSRKFTLGIFPGPSLLLFGVTITFLGLVLTGIQSLANPFFYLFIVIGVISIRIVLKVMMVLSTRDITIPRMNPFSWLIIRESDSAYTLELYRFLRGTTFLGQYPKYEGTTKENLVSFMNLPEVRRHQYNSYISVAIRRGDTVTFFDPLRKEKFVWYPPDYVSVEIPI